ncbi:hypothetical protein IE53DRAFT_57922 [Violaceomyces palustris]|uniref:Uncharacterized protein n=1 Tax=Violaceomyces palustris TaxID=1673888 RepID=A0ACD0NZP4_9BASI|nr:hypothetical protein IE53DRAFT_57922 [Violaceomyces palustris]
MLSSPSHHGPHSLLISRPEDSPGCGFIPKGKVGVIFITSPRLSYLSRYPARIPSRSLSFLSFFFLSVASFSSSPSLKVPNLPLRSIPSSRSFLSDPCLSTLPIPLLKIQITALRQSAFPADLFPPSRPTVSRSPSE